MNRALILITALALPSLATAATVYTGTVASVTVSGYKYDTATGLLDYSYSHIYLGGGAYTITAGPDLFMATINGYGYSGYDYSPAPLTDTGTDGSFNEGNWNNFNASITALNAGATYLRGYVTPASGYFGGEESVTYDLSGRGVATVPQPTSAVPEPESWVLMLVGFGVLGAALRRRKAFA